MFTSHPTTRIRNSSPLLLVTKIRILDISATVPRIQKIKKRGAFIFGFWLWEDPPHPVNWFPTHSTGPQTPFFTDISATVAQIKKSKNEVHLFSNFASGRTLPTQSTGPQPIQLGPKHRFYRYLSNGLSNPKKIKKRGAFIFEFWLWKDPCAMRPCAMQRCVGHTA